MRGLKKEQWTGLLWVIPSVCSYGRPHRQSSFRGVLSALFNIHSFTRILTALSGDRCVMAGCPWLCSFLYLSSPLLLPPPYLCVFFSLINLTKSTPWAPGVLVGYTNSWLLCLYSWSHLPTQNLKHDKLIIGQCRLSEAVNYDQQLMDKKNPAVTTNPYGQMCGRCPVWFCDDVCWVSEVY